ncbi:hypothetical protein BHF71_11120 [Vulcanibacillus modesticaldus]|uniref:Alcohol dehydrogenase iron-type/glycerol dehydrogenase GldA domain-containing protein n=1 Tax=Vulcanibacillus modesticaldus TaxID=337097 RepID=A0A1D2YSM7_9BACI|nr:iron-containing alcohol dehydrogenase [Vulcanibacillus modesticaldus]OEF97695.1 hypothetical protein BHF71_11120 [Vulcanibacillus modesticaldus]
MSYNFYMPSLSLMGADSLISAGDEIVSLGYKKALIVTDKVLVENGLVKKLTDMLDSKDIKYVIFDGTQPNPTVKNVEDGLAMLREHGCDFVISFGSVKSSMKN